MAGIALCGKTVENARSQLLVALVALNCGMRAQQRKAVLVILYLLHGDIPPLYGVTLGAIRPHLTAVHIGVAVGAIFACVCKDRLNMALDAVHLFVHPAQRIVGLVVIKFWDRSYRTPSRSGMAVLAGNGEGAVRVASRFFLRIGCKRHVPRGHPHWARVGDG